MAEDKAVLIKTAYSYYQRGDWDRAIEEYHKLADLDPKDLNVHNMLADIYSKKGDVPDALQQYDLVAQGFDEKNQIDKVLQVYKRMLKLVPGDPALSSAVQSLVEKYLVRARELEETQPSKSAEIYRSILRAEPNRIDATFQLARLLMKSGQKYEAIESLMNLASGLDPETQTGRLSEVLQMVAEIDPVNVEARETLTKLLVKGGQNALALRNLQSLIEIYISQNDYVKAEESAQQALALGDQNTFYHLGVIYFNQQKYAESRQSFERFLQLQETHVGALKYLALDYLRMNQNQDAVRVYQRILDVYFHENLLDEAREVRQTILELDPANQVVGQYALDQELVPAAETIPSEPAPGEAAPTEVPAATDEADQQGFLIEAQAYAEKGLYEQAIDVYLDMLKRWPDLAEIRVRLQQVYALMARSNEPVEKAPDPEEIKAELEQRLREQMRQELDEQARVSRQLQDELERKREIEQLKLRQELESKLMEQVHNTREEDLRQRLTLEFEEKQKNLSLEKEQIENERQQILEKMRSEMESSRAEMERKIREQLENEYREKTRKEVVERETQTQDAKEREKNLVEAQAREREEQVRAQFRLEEERRRQLEAQKKEQEAAKARINQEIFQGMERIRQEKEKETRQPHSAPAPASPTLSSPVRASSGTSEAIDDPFIRKTLADIYAAQGLYVEALKIYERILSEEPENHEVKEKLRDILRMKGI